MRRERGLPEAAARPANAGDRSTGVGVKNASVAVAARAKAATRTTIQREVGIGLPALFCFWRFANSILKCPNVIIIIIILMMIDDRSSMSIDRTRANSRGMNRHEQ